MIRVGALLIAATVLTAACGDDNPSGPSAGTAPAVFTATLSPANEVPAVTNAEATAGGVAQISVSGGSATFYFQLRGLAGGTNIVGAMALVGDRTAMAAAAANDVWVVYPLDPAPGRQWVPFVWLAVSAIGCWVQLGFTGGEKGRVGRRRRKRS